MTTLADDGLWLIDPKTLGVRAAARSATATVEVGIGGGTAFVAADSAYGPDVDVTPVDAEVQGTLWTRSRQRRLGDRRWPGRLAVPRRIIGGQPGEQNPFGELLRVGGASEATGTLSRNSRTFGTRILQRIPIPGPPANEENSGDAVGLAIGAGGVLSVSATPWRGICEVGDTAEAGHIEAKVRLPFVPRSVAWRGRCGSRPSSTISSHGSTQ